MRATVDLDEPTRLEVIKAWGRLQSHGDGRVSGRVSSSGTGVHLKVHGVDPEHVEQIRRLCGDDPKRLQYDHDSELKPQQILFDRKRNGTATEWTDDMDQLIQTYERRRVEA